MYHCITIMISGGSRSSDKGGAGHPVPEIRGRRVLKKFFSALWASAGAPPLDLPLMIHLSNIVLRTGYITAWDQSMVQTWRDKRQEKHCQFSFLWANTTTQRWSLKQKETIFKVIPEEKQQLVEENDADNIRKVLVIHSVLLRIKFVFL